jgi:hypothetical protein
MSEYNKEIKAQTAALYNVRCTGLLKNHMQCIRQARWRKPDDISGREALCSICVAFIPEDIKAQYTVEMEPK